MVMQGGMFGLSVIMIYHAFWGPSLAPKNLATLLTWVHFRGMVVLVIALAGNLFCMSCPLILPRDLVRRFVNPKWNWPRLLRNKWPAIVLFVAVLFAYELFDLWSSPRWTGALIVGYFIVATLIDTMFKQASFCKYVCPVGQFNFLSATMSPTEIAVLDMNVCRTCQTKDCIRGVASSSSDAMDGKLPIVQRGCELALYQPRKVGNIDCTYCLDCVYACPHDNVGLVQRLPAEELAIAGSRSGLGSLERRPDFSALIIVFTFGALLNAFAMISPVYVLEQWIAHQLGITIEWPILAGMFVVALVIEPIVLIGTAAVISQRASGTHRKLAVYTQHFMRSLIPLGFAIWLAHYGFHFFTGFLTVIPVTQHAVQQTFGTALLGSPQWQLGGMPESLVFVLEVGFMILGLCGACAVTLQVARNLGVPRAHAAAAPWIALHCLLFFMAMWILSQPMDMRGTFLGA
jgi:ferredoxin